MTRERFTIELEPLPARAGEPPVELRVRHLLKIALRGLRLRCVSVDGVEHGRGDESSAIEKDLQDEPVEIF